MSKKNVVATRFWVLFITSLCISCLSNTSEVSREPQGDFMQAVANDLKLCSKSETESANLQVVLQNVVSGESVQMSDLAGKFDHTIFFYYSQSHCNQCVFNEFSFIKKYYSNAENVIIIGKEKSLRILRVLRKNEQIQNPMYWMDMQSSFNFSFEQLNRPVFFKLNADGRPYNIYSPKFSYPQFSEIYHKTMSDILALNHSDN
ncbi:MAG: hypothetical protein JNK18_15515 [Cyclobacteriaceae bacterium]|nr:hypothetical protein [Cyclobacteriaceae bacterium]